MNSGIYIITNVINGKVYVGSSKNLRKRKYNHFSYLRNNKHKNLHLQASWNSYGEQAFHWEILECCKPKNLQEREDWWIELLDSRNPDKGYNLAKADRSEVLEETKQKISAFHKGKQWALGRKHSEEVREKIGSSNKVALKGRNLAEEHKANISKGLLGHVVSEDTKRKIAKTKIGKSHSEETKAKISTANRGKPGTWTGRRHTEESKIKMSTTKLSRKREIHNSENQ